jgi:hypothetical protein
MASVDLPGAAEVPRHRIKPHELVWFRVERGRNPFDNFNHRDMSKDNTCAREQYAPQDRTRQPQRVALRDCGFGVVEVDQSGWFVEIRALHRIE